jgi:DNA-binding GntR family transcriptional regulator
MSAVPTKQRIVDDITEDIRSGRLKAGDQLPTSPQLRAKYDTSLVTVRAAVSVLKAMALVESVHGVGVFVK